MISWLLKLLMLFPAITYAKPPIGFSNLCTQKQPFLNSSLGICYNYDVYLKNYYKDCVNLDPNSDEDSLRLLHLPLQQAKHIFDRELQLISRIPPGTIEFKSTWNSFQFKWERRRVEHLTIFGFDRVATLLKESEKNALNRRIEMIPNLRMKAINQANYLSHIFKVPGADKTALLSLIIMAAKFSIFKGLPDWDSVLDGLDLLDALYPEIYLEPGLVDLSVSFLEKNGVMNIVSARDITTREELSVVTHEILKKLDAKSLRGLQAQEIFRLFVRGIQENIDHLDGYYDEMLSDPKSVLENGLPISAALWSNFSSEGYIEQQKMQAVYCQQENYRERRAETIDSFIEISDQGSIVFGFGSMGLSILASKIKNYGMRLIAKRMKLGKSPGNMRVTYGISSKNVAARAQEGADVATKIGLPIFAAASGSHFSKSILEWQDAVNGFYLRTSLDTGDDVKEKKEQILMDGAWAALDLFTFLPGVFNLMKLRKTSLQ